MKRRSPKSVFSVCLRNFGSVCLQGHGRENQLSTSKVPRPWAVVETEKLRPDERDFGYCFSVPFLCGVPWSCQGGLEVHVPGPVLGHSSLPSPWVLSSLFPIFAISRFHLFAVLVGGKFYVRQSNLHCHDQRDVRITAYSWFLLTWWGETEFTVNTELCLQMLIISIQLPLITFHWSPREGVRLLRKKKKKSLVRDFSHTTSPNKL